MNFSDFNDNATLLAGSLQPQIDWMQSRDYLKDKFQGNKDSQIVVTYPPTRFLNTGNNIKWTTATVANTVYLHIPFCTGICSYCSYLTKGAVEGSDETDRYVDLLIKELELYRNTLGKLDVETCYIGGGTPTMLTVQQLDRLLSAINNTFNVLFEYTLEGSPETITVEKIQVARSHGINRVSIGVESWNDNILAAIRRRHNVKEALEAIERIHSAGIDDVDIDLIRGLPESSMQTAYNDVQTTLSANCTSMTNYQYAVKPRSIDQKFIVQIDENIPNKQQAVMQHLGIMDAMEKTGYIHNPVDWFYTGNHPYNHNIYKWRHNANQIALGIGSYGYWEGTQYKNTKTVAEYQERLEQEQLPIDSSSKLTLDEQMRRHFILGLKTGVDVSELASRYHLDVTATNWWSNMQDLINNEIFHFDGTILTPNTVAKTSIDKIQEMFYNEKYNDS
jgi:putative oxygen-independent coproporphyrinogen III oxidase